MNPLIILGLGITIAGIVMKPEDKESGHESSGENGSDGVSRNRHCKSSASDSKYRRRSSGVGYESPFEGDENNPETGFENDETKGHENEVSTKRTPIHPVGDGSVGDDFRDEQLRTDSESGETGGTEQPIKLPPKTDIDDSNVEPAETENPTDSQPEN